MAENKFVVKMLSMLRDSPEVLTENDFATRKEAEEFRDLAAYAMKLNYGEDQKVVSFVIEEI